MICNIGFSVKNVCTPFPSLSFFVFPLFSIGYSDFKKINCVVNLKHIAPCWVKTWTSTCTIFIFLSHFKTFSRTFPFLLRISVSEAVHPLFVLKNYMTFKPSGLRGAAEGWRRMGGLLLLCEAAGRTAVWAHRSWDQITTYSRCLLQTNTQEQAVLSFEQM